MRHRAEICHVVKDYLGAKPWAIVRQRELRFMECNNGGYQRQAQPRTWRVSAGIEPVKPLKNLAALINWNPGAIIGNGYHNITFCPPDRQADVAAGRGMNKRIFDQVGDRLGK